ncbi:MAG TPA: hypothetical protein VLF93_01940 [Candidatus Saccharimonadales bacterium]|nr:hypothetical protein [Candidatus Saccharimonadales bacterium]
MFDETIAQLDKVRKNNGFLTFEDLVQLSKNNNTIMDPFSLFISREVVVEKDNIFYPNVVIEANKGKISIGNGNIFYMNTYIIAKKGLVTIGNKNQFGSGGCTIQALEETAKIIVGNKGRYSNNPLILGRTTLGSGTQILGNIIIKDCTLEDGGNFEEPNPNLRGAVLKGAGIAQHIYVQKGYVINAYGDFKDSPIELQSTYHPKH